MEQLDAARGELLDDQLVGRVNSIVQVGRVKDVKEVEQRLRYWYRLLRRNAWRLLPFCKSAGVPGVAAMSMRLTRGCGNMGATSDAWAVCQLRRLK